MKGKFAVTTGVAAIAALFGARSFWSSRDAPYGRLAILSRPNPKFRIVPRSAFETKPRIDIAISGGNRFVWPAREKDILAADFLHDHSMAAGIIQYDRLYMCEWIFTGTSYSSQQAGKGYVVPSVFGTEPQTVELRDSINSEATTIMLPATGQPAPVLSDRTVRVGEITIRFHPLPVFSPMVAPRFEVTIAGAKPGVTYAIQFARNCILVPKNNRAILHLAKWNSRPIPFSVTPIRRSLVFLECRLGRSSDTLLVHSEDGPVKMRATTSGGVTRWTDGRKVLSPPWFTLCDLEKPARILPNTDYPAEDEAFEMNRRGEKFWLQATLLEALGPRHNSAIDLGLPDQKSFDIQLVPSEPGRTTWQQPFTGP